MNLDPSPAQISLMATKAGKTVAEITALANDAKTDLQKAKELIALLLLCWLDCINTMPPASSGGNP